MAICVVLNKTFSILIDWTGKAKTTIKERKERQKLKDKLLEQVEASTPNKRWGRAKKLSKVLDEIIYKATDRGFSFNGRDTLMQLCDCKSSTIDEAMRIIKESDLFEIVYRENPNSNGYKTPVIILKSHPNYEYIKEILEVANYKQEVKQEVENFQNSTESKVEGEKTKPTNHSLQNDPFTENNINNNEEDYLDKINHFTLFYLSKDRQKAKELIDKNPFLHITVKQRARKIVELLPEEFSQLDWTVFADLMLALNKRQPLKPVGYVVKAFYKNKLVEAEKLGLSLEHEHIREDMLPKNFKIMKLIDTAIEKMKAYERTGNMDMVNLCQLQIDRYREQLNS